MDLPAALPNITTVIEKSAGALGIPTGKVPTSLEAAKQKATGAATDAAMEKGKKAADQGVSTVKEWTAGTPGIEIPKDQAAAKEAMENPKAEGPSLIEGGKKLFGAVTELLGGDKKGPETPEKPKANDIDGARVHLVGKNTDVYGVVHGPEDVDLPANGKVSDPKIKKDLTAIYKDANAQGASKVECSNADLVATMNGIGKEVGKGSKLKTEWVHVAHETKPAEAPKPESQTPAAPAQAPSGGFQPQF